ncbi:MAG: hypothetical protein JNJ43_06225 [Anaerolineales bacterium]|nr:hypothetical protein [Anaerolineales bacterium]
MKNKNLQNNKKLNGIDYDDTILKYTYIPMLVGVFIMLFSIFVIQTGLSAKIILFIGMFIMGLSGYWQVKYKSVPGMPPLRGGCAVVFGIFFILVFSLGALVGIWSVIFDK